MNSIFDNTILDRSRFDPKPELIVTEEVVMLDNASLGLSEIRQVIKLGPDTTYINIKTEKEVITT